MATETLSPTEASSTSADVKAAQPDTTTTDAKSPPEAMRALVLGGSGQVGSKLVALLRQAPDCALVTVVSRRPLPDLATATASTEGVEVRLEVVPDLMTLADRPFPGHNVAFNLLGLGQPRKCSKEELERVDATIPTLFAQACRQSGVRHFSHLSSIGADSKQQYSALTRTGAGGGWYLHVKGVVEEQLQKVGFSSLLTVRPAGIYPGNKNTPSVLGWLNQALNPILPGAYETASSVAIASAMLISMRQQLAGEREGFTVLEGGQAIKRVAEGKVGSVLPPASSLSPPTEKPRTEQEAQDTAPVSTTTAAVTTTTTTAAATTTTTVEQ